MTSVAQEPKDDERYEQLESSPISEELTNAETLLETDRDKYLSDSYEDTPSKAPFCQRYFGPIKAGSLRGAIVSVASLCFGISGFFFPKGFDNLGFVPAAITFISYWTLSMLLFSARKKK